jgi:PBP superfamily domain
MNNLKLASAIALALGGISAAQAGTAPTLAQCQSPTDTLFVAGSSAAQNAFANALNTDAFGGAGVTFKASNGNFEAFCGISANASFAPVGNSVVVHYRAEGGSVVGALPIVSTKPVKFLNLASATSLGQTLTTTGTSETVGTTDGWGGPLIEHAVEVGVTDLEPAQFVGKNYPSAYSTSVFGSATAAQLAGLSKTVLFDQVFGLFVNTSGLNGGGTGQAINLSKQAYANILDGNYTDWSQVPTTAFTSGAATTAGVVSNVAAPITVINREAGSGTRTGASIYFLGYNCGQTATFVNDPNPAADYYATSDELAAASATPGGIAYASIDNAGKANLTTVSLNGIVPSNLAATAGDYGWWYEAQLIKGTITSTGGPTIYSFLTTELANVNTAPHAADILAVPGAGSPKNAVSVPVVANTSEPGSAIYVNPFTHSSSSCSVVSP